MHKNQFAEFIKVASLVLGLFGVIGAFVLGKVNEVVETYSLYSKAHYNWALALTDLLVVVITCSLLYAVGEAIDLLQQIVNNQKISAPADRDKK